MGKSKQQNRKPDEELLGENRLYRKQIKKLQQEIRRLQKDQNYAQNKTSKSIEVKEKEFDCKECGKSDLIVSDIGIRRYTICPLCNDRKRID